MRKMKTCFRCPEKAVNPSDISGQPDGSVKNQIAVLLRALRHCSAIQ